MGCGKEGLGFEFSVVHGGRPLIEGGGVLGGVTIVMGRYWKSTFLRYLFAFLTRDQELAVHTSEQVLSPGGLARLKVGDALLECGMAEEDGGVGCSISYRMRKEAYLLYEGFILTLRYGFAPPGSAGTAARLLQLVGDVRQGSYASSSDLLAKTLEKAVSTRRVVADRRPPGLHASRRRLPARGPGVVRQGAARGGDAFALGSQGFPMPPTRCGSARHARGR